MGKLKAYGFNLRKEDYEIINRMVSIIDTTQPAEILDLRSFGAEVDSDDILFLYGPRALKECEAFKCLAKIEFPDVSKLDVTFGDEQERELAHQKLLRLKEALASGKLSEPDSLLTGEITKKISGESLPALTSGEISGLEATLRKKKVTSWNCKGKDGTTIRVTIEPEDSNADIDITFRELYALKACMEALHVEEFGIVYKPTASGNKDSSE